MQSKRPKRRTTKTKSTAQPLPKSLRELKSKLFILYLVFMIQMFYYSFFFSARNKAKPATVVTTVSSTPTVINLDQEISRRSIRQSTPTPPATASTRPPSGRSHTPTRQTAGNNPSTAVTANSTPTPKLNKKANNSQLKKVVPEEKPKRNSSPTNNSGSSIVLAASNSASTAASQATNEAKKGMKTRSNAKSAAASATASAVGRS